uniref:Uncharacterized protein n=1 Tax=Zea mays TaxID=4577 RepID=B4FFA8_MAIZE|nr:unknown [Zea mays]
MMRRGRPLCTRSAFRDKCLELARLVHHLLLFMSQVSSYLNVAALRVLMQRCLCLHLTPATVHT